MLQLAVIFDQKPYELSVWHSSTPIFEEALMPSGQRSTSQSRTGRELGEVARGVTLGYTPAL